MEREKLLLKSSLCLVVQSASISCGSAYAKAPKVHNKRHIAPVAIPGFRFRDIGYINFYISIINKKVAFCDQTQFLGKEKV